MPVISRLNLPTYDRLAHDGYDIMDKSRAEHQDIREIHIGVLNMMQDAALEATERQFTRLLSYSSRVMQIYVHFFNIDGIERSKDAKAHIDQYYEDFETLKKEGLDGLIITGTNLSNTDITKAPFWPHFCEVVDWAKDNVASTLCACLATHAVAKHLYGIDRKPLGEKLWGVFPHRAEDRDHPLMLGMNTVFNVVHSRHNDISREEFERAGAHVLVDSEAAGVHMATSADGFRFVMLQGHPEYDTQSLLKEYKREVLRHINGERADYPPFPDRYLGPQCQAILKEYQKRIIDDPNLPFPEDIIAERLHDTWRDTAKSLMNNWIGNIYQTTNLERTKQYMDGVDPNRPLAARQKP